MELVEKLFKLKENKTTVRTEMLAGLTTFMTMAYILAVNPIILSATGMDQGALITATAIATAVATLLMAFLANYPVALAPGMGINAFFAYTVVLGMGYSWQIALTAVFIEGLIFIALSLLPVREAIFNAIPLTLKSAVSVGIGLFIAFIGLQNAGVLAKSDATMVTLGNLHEVGAFLTLIGTIITIVLCIRRVKGALLWGILITWGLGIICQLTGVYVVDIAAGRFNLIPAAIVSAPPSLAPIAFKFDFSAVLSLNFLVIMITFLFVDIFDTVGTLIGVSIKADMLDKDGKLPRVKGALLSDAIGTTVGAALGTSTIVAYIESSAGVSEGGRTGLTAFFTGILFVLALLFAPLFLAIPGFATAPALIVVGLFMMEAITKINFAEFTEGFPAFMTIIMMPLCYNIADGLVFGFLSYVLLKLFAGKAKELNYVVLIIAVIFALKLIFAPS
jgi:AGZA family xanthine/uracil permease-like MFS transporter